MEKLALQYVRRSGLHFKYVVYSSMYSVSQLNETIETGVVMEMLRLGYSPENMHISLLPWASVTNA